MGFAPPIVRISFLSLRTALVFSRERSVAGSNPTVDGIDEIASSRKPRDSQRQKRYPRKDNRRSVIASRSEAILPLSPLSLRTAVKQSHGQRN